MKKILIVEDDLNIADLEKDYLEVNEFEVTVENDGIKGLENARKNNYDLIILDLMLPGLDGFRICKTLREETDIPILLVTAKGEDIDKIRGLGIGADDYITKPFSPGELVARVKAHISKYDRLVSKDSVSEVIEIRSLKIDNHSRRVYLDGKEIQLTTKEFDLLYMLASSPNKVFTKEYLYEHIWDMTSIGDLPTVTVHIRKLREKIEKDPANPEYIHTVWGTGYRFE
ncbi:MAG: response regulator transcription factor [Clostridia bacterium]|jgi:DNA-binding response OmpR family regulator|nr:response regulator transcription factor [Clostridia bacterium]